MNDSSFALKAESKSQDTNTFTWCVTSPLRGYKSAQTLQIRLRKDSICAVPAEPEQVFVEAGRHRASGRRFHLAVPPPEPFQESARYLVQPVPSRPLYRFGRCDS